MKYYLQVIVSCAKIRKNKSLRGIVQMKGKKLIDKKSMYVVAALFVMFAILAYFFPYSGDDWAWGSSIGVTRLKSWFRNYNGRYAGNLLVLLLTRVKLLQILFVAGSIVFLSFASKLFNRSESISVVMLSAGLFLLLPKQVLVQSLAWTSGYSNYVPPILLCILYMVLVRNIFDEEQPVYRRFMPCMTFLMGFIGALFMENLTLYSIAMSFLVIAFVWLRFRKFFVVHVAYFAGAFAGAVMMFTNGAYFNIANNTDTYRSTALTKGLLKTVASHCKIISEQFFINNFPMLLVISILCVVLTTLHMKNCKDSRRVYASWVAVFVNILCLGILYSKEGFGYWVMAVGNPKSADYTLVTMLLAAFMYCFAVLMTVLLCVTEKMAMYKLLFWLVSVPVVIAPLVLVNPIGPRNFFPPYALLVMFCGTLLHYIQERYSAGATAKMGISVSLAAVTASLFLFFVSIYGTIHSYDVRREQYVQKQVEQGCEEITVCKLPYTSYVWYGDPTTEPWGERFKLFNGLDTDVKLNFLSYSEFNSWAEQYDAE